MRAGMSIDVEALRPGPGAPWALHLERVNPQGMAQDTVPLAPYAPQVVAAMP